jgi:hypothetical protein
MADLLAVCDDDYLLKTCIKVSHETSKKNRTLSLNVERKFMVWDQQFVHLSETNNATHDVSIKKVIIVAGHSLMLKTYCSEY